MLQRQVDLPLLCGASRMSPSEKNSKVDIYSFSLSNSPLLLPCSSYSFVIVWLQLSVLLSSFAWVLFLVVVVILLRGADVSLYDALPTPSPAQRKKREGSVYPGL